ncbi:hypothetical protein ACOSQ3_014786 [Xanthoceras sorbifolium]
MSKDKSDVFLVRFNGKNYFVWEFHFKVFVKGKDLWGHIDEVKDVQVMTWILESIEPNLMLNLRPSKTAAETWTYLKKVYCQNNMARRFQLELELQISNMTVFLSLNFTLAS